MKGLNLFIEKARIPQTYKNVYWITQDIFLQQNPELREGDWGQEMTRKVVQKAGTAVVPMATNALSYLGVEAGTGVAISSLSGAATGRV